MLHPSLTGLSEEELTDKLNPTGCDWMLRRNFWKIVEREQDNPTITVTGKKTSFGNMDDLYKGACSRQYFNKEVIPNPVRVAFIVRPIVDAGGYYEAINRVALRKTLEIVQNLPADSKHLTQLLKILDRTGDRAYGAVTQQIQMKTKNLNIEVQERQLPPGGDNMDIGAKLEAARSKLLEAPKDVVTSSDENES